MRPRPSPVGGVTGGGRSRRNLRNADAGVTHVLAFPPEPCHTAVFLLFGIVCTVRTRRGKHRLKHI